MQIPTKLYNLISFSNFNLFFNYLKLILYGKVTDLRFMVKNYLTNLLEVLWKVAELKFIMG